MVEEMTMILHKTRLRRYCIRKENYWRLAMDEEIKLIKDHIGYLTKESQRWFNKNKLWKRIWHSNARHFAEKKNLSKKTRKKYSLRIQRRCLYEEGD